MSGQNFMSVVQSEIPVLKNVDYSILVFTAACVYQYVLHYICQPITNSPDRVGVTQMVSNLGDPMRSYMILAFFLLTKTFNQTTKSEHPFREPKLRSWNVPLPDRQPSQKAPRAKSFASFAGDLPW